MTDPKATIDGKDVEAKDVLAFAKEQLRLIDVWGMCDSEICQYHGWIKEVMPPLVLALETERERADGAELEKQRIKREDHNCYEDCVSKTGANQRIATEQERLMKLVVEPEVNRLEGEISRLRILVHWVMIQCGKSDLAELRYIKAEIEQSSIWKEGEL